MSMGLPIENLHSPSVDRSNGPENIKENATLEQLISQKQHLEEELDALGDVLKSHGVTMNTGLTTFDGFPRADIDVAQIRTTRSRIIYLRNDHKTLMSRIEAGLHSHFASDATSTAARSSAARQAASLQTTIQTLPTSRATFAKVDSVTPGSPADSAGLRAGDRIQEFGEANWLNHEKLSKVAQIVGQSEGRSVPVAVLRQLPTTGSWEQHQLTLVPRSNWGGRGLLGCHLVPD